MNAFDSVMVLLAFEALIALVVIGSVVFFALRKRRGKELAEIDRFIDDLDEQGYVRDQALENFLGRQCGIAANDIQSLLERLNASERALFQDVIRLFLKRELALLSEIEQKIGALTLPFQELLATRVEARTETSGDSAHAQQLAGMERINQQLVKQLDNAMKTIDEMSAEYTRVFSGNQTALELENSSKKMMQIFHDAEHVIHQLMAELKK